MTTERALFLVPARTPLYIRLSPVAGGYVDLRFNVQHEAGRGAESEVYERLTVAEALDVVEASVALAWAPWEARERLGVDSVDDLHQVRTRRR